MATESKRDDRPKKKKKKKSSNFELWVGLGIGGVVLLIALIATGVVIAMNRKQAGEANKGNPPVAQKPPAPPPPPGNQRGAVIKNPKTTLGNVRARGDQTARDAEMRGIIDLYQAYTDEVKNPTARNLQGFLQSIRTAPAKTFNSVKDKEYMMNFKARPGSEDIVVYESEKYDRGYYCFRANNQSDYVSAQDLNAAGLAAP